MGIPKKGPVIAIDGPAGTGKSTVTRAIADQFGLVYVDTGALYRAIGLLSIEAQILDSHILKQKGSVPAGSGLAEKVSKIAKEAHLEFKRSNGATELFANGRDITDLIRTAEVGVSASVVGSIPEVRSALLGIQRKLGLSAGSVLEGRDIGTVIFPDADLKIYLNAKPEVRARRRYEELIESGQSPVPTLEELTQQVRERDERDSGRAIAPLKKADDAIEIDTSDLSLEQVVAKVSDRVKECLDHHWPHHPQPQTTR